jgi:hypothetical protein
MKVRSLSDVIKVMVSMIVYVCVCLHLRVIMFAFEVERDR